MEYIWKLILRSAISHQETWLRLWKYRILSNKRIQLIRAVLQKNLLISAAVTTKNKLNLIAENNYPKIMSVAFKIIVFTTLPQKKFLLSHKNRMSMTLNFRKQNSARLLKKSMNAWWDWRKTCNIIRTSIERRSPKLAIIDLLLFNNKYQISGIKKPSKKNLFDQLQDTGISFKLFINTNSLLPRIFSNIFWKTVL